MKRAIIAAIAIITAVTIFSAGAITAGFRHWFEPAIKITIYNSSGGDVKTAKITLSTIDSTTSVILKNLSKNQKRTVLLYSFGESSYTLEATLTNGKVVKGGNGYVESGYSTTEIIETNRVHSLYNFGL